MSEGRHIDLFAILLFGYRYPAAPQDLREGWCLRTEVDGPVDRDRLVDAVERVLRPNEFILDETWSHHSAGEDRSTPEIGIGVPTGVGAGIIDQLVLVAQSYVGGPHPSGAPIPVEEAAGDARRMLAQGRGVSTDSIQIEEVRDQPSGVRLMLRGPGDERYAVDVDERAISIASRDWVEPMVPPIRRCRGEKRKARQNDAQERPHQTSGMRAPHSVDPNVFQHLPDQRRGELRPSLGTQSPTALVARRQDARVVTTRHQHSTS